MAPRLSKGHSLERVKELLEAKKLRAEIRDLNARFKYDSEQRAGEHRPSATLRDHWLPVVISMLGIVSTVVTVAITARTYLDQQDRQYEFDLSHNNQAIDLVNKDLRSKDKQVREGAAILLAAFERHAVPLLLMNLTLPGLEDPDPAIHSLMLIKKNPRVKPRDQVVSPLLDRAEQEFRDRNLNSEQDVIILSHVNKALGRLAEEEKP